MFGLFMLGVIGCGCFYNAMKNASWDGNHKQESIKNNESYYMDWQGSYRRVDNDHKVCLNMTDWSNGDIVDIDLKTNQMLNRRPSRERELIERTKSEYLIKNREAKEKAIKEGKMWYSSYEITEKGLQRNKIYPFDFVSRRVSDDLLLDQTRTSNNAMYDEKFSFVLWRSEKEYKKYPSYYSPEKDKEYNWRQIKSNYTQERYNMSEHELEKYARKIGAIL